MFGSKLRSWMETHIVRPRKKGNKRKELESGSAGKKAGTLPQSSNLKSKSTTLPTSPVLTSSGGSHSVIASPVRRREVSPIQCHTPSRYGWQSPDQDTITSPKSDNLLYAPHRYHRQPQIPPKSSQQLNVPNSKDSSSADKSPIKVNCSSSSISSLSWSTGSKEPSMHSTVAKHTTFKLESAELALSRSYSDYHDTMPELVATAEEEVEYEEVGALLLRPQPPQGRQDIADYQRPHSENLTSLHLSYDMKSSEDSNHVRYGRLLPSKLATQVSDSVESLTVKSECLAAPLPVLPPAPSVGRLRNSRGLPRSNLMPGSRAPLGMAGPPHSLSSPESAYSTGYSTDGTSPCAGNYNPPEYYINMRTGTHYFPKSVNSLAIEAQRYKFGLNRIEEMSPLDPLPKSSFGNTCANNFGQPRLEPSPSPLALRHAAPKLFESPSPRQRCRIRTNPWYSTGETPAMHLTPAAGAATASATTTIMRMEVDATSTTSTTSSGIKSSNELEALAMERSKKNGNKLGMGMGTSAPTNMNAALLSKSYESSEGSSSSTEVENARAYSPHTIKRKHFERLGTMVAASEQAACSKDIIHRQVLSECQIMQQESLFVVSDDEATLNEMIGKFDESYVYEKETDILSSDSDPTDCASELDTGQDAGDECDTDELLDIDFIDTSSMQELVLERKELQRNLGSCHYYPNTSPTRSALRQSFERKSSVRSRRSVRSAKNTQDVQSGGVVSSAALQRRRKRFMKTRKKSCENRDKHLESPLQRPRESRSVGGTPVCLRRNHQLGGAKDRIYKTSPLSNRSNSLIFGTVPEKHFMTIAESEKALLKADMEADMKYRQLIMEAESLLESMKNSLQSIPRDTPVASPRRLNPLANKRVEMLKNSEVESKKQAAPQKEPTSDHELAAAINKRIELLKFETASAPNSPKMGRCSPRKTHLTNFMNQNAPPELPPRKNNAADQPYKVPLSPQLQLNGRRLQSSPLGSPRSSRRLQSSPSPSPRRSGLWNMALLNLNGSDSELECITVERQSTEDVANHNYLQQEPALQFNNADYNNSNVALSESSVQASFYCPHSEPLKRKVYKGSSSFERIKKTFDLELDMSQQTKTDVCGFPGENRQQQSKLVSVSAKSSMHDVNNDTAETQSNHCKQQILLSTIVDLKRSLEHQSYELSGLNGE
ncbi:uncharacterized protein LOC115631545 isoform X1 [Scaptodrosophila lebanonensis]|uniref:Uncharacterized protein LOC115631545 isoform X1 n=1 Tax=Drosophila lebanonensis TaxID=7225 RepID=A0A6J2U873_DROLE|nr:uncharacterized protein LOC115631545 isoform X1 [Scaptodrosophila lebanonensis]